MYAFLIPFALGGFAIPNIQSIITQKVPSNEQGELQGGLTSLISITAILGPLIMSNSFAYFTAPENNIYFPGIAFLIGAVLSIVGLIFSYFTLKNMR
jgi:DHA1 family tetracycline resistance protein-like MFS transporter